MMSDDNEFARYLAQYLVDNYLPERLQQNELEELIKAFMDRLP